MNSQRWREIDQIFQAAVEQPPELRASFLDETCSGDEALRREVEALISSDEQNWSFIDSPAFEVAAPILSQTHLVLDIGQHLAYYEVVELVGKGGMGEVYLAEDTRLGRKVALKLLSADLTRNASLVALFQQEARAASSLNHPNILTIHEIGKVDDRQFIATEFIEGETLRQKIRRDKLSLSEVLDITVQVTGALAAAHAAGIVHKDIKPENIMVRPDGYVKVLDFGLAELVGPRPSTNQSESLTDKAMPVRGTVRYMSPEQARGLAVDARSDIFSLGVVLYEMIAGRVPFEGETTTDRITALLNQEPPPLRQYAPNTPAELQNIVSKALRKETGERYQTSAEFLVAVTSLKQGLDLKLSGPAHVSWIKRLNTASVLTILLISVASGIFVLSRILHKSSARFSDLSVTRLTSSGSANRPAISPDGKFVVYGRYEGSPFKASLWLRELDSANEIQIAPPAERVYERFGFSPDGKYLYYSAAPARGFSSFCQLPVPGGPERKLPTPGVIAFCFSPDGQRIAFSRNKLGLGETVITTANADGADEQEIVTRKAPNYFPNQTISWSPDGRFIACVGRSAAEGYPRVIEVNVDERTERPITSQKWQDISGIAWLPDMSGMILVASEENASAQQVWYVSYPSGEARRVTNDVNNYQSISLNADGNAFVTRQVETESRIWVMPVEGNESSVESTNRISIDTASARQISTGRFDGASGLSWTPDGRIVFTSEASGNLDLWIMDGDGGNRKQLTTDSHNDISPSVSPDGRFVVFTSNRTGADHVWRMDIDGGALRQLTNGHVERGPYCAPDGKWVSFNSWESGKATIWKVPIDGGPAVQVTETQSMGPRISPDGKLIAYGFQDAQRKVGIGIMDTDGTPVRTFDITREKVVGRPTWILNGRALALTAITHGVVNIRLLPLDGRPQRQLTDFKSKDTLGQYEFSRDGKRLACSRVSETSDVILVRLK
jgi:serine/threonine protein kinase